MAEVIIPLKVFIKGELDGRTTANDVVALVDEMCKQILEGAASASLQTSSLSFEILCARRLLQSEKAV